ncbi:MAG: hypothetical protein ABR585_10805 [Gemmatimonadaceae bacterium]
MPASGAGEVDAKRSLANVEAPQDVIAGQQSDVLSHRFWWWPPLAGDG